MVKKDTRTMREIDPESSSMKVITTSIPRVYLDLMKKATDLGLYPSRSEIIRYGMNEVVARLVEDIERVHELINKDDFPSVREYIEERGFKLVRKSPKDSSYPRRKPKREPLGNPFYKEVYNKTTKEFMKIPINVEEGA